jgi:hypothetical protein
MFDIATHARRDCADNTMMTHTVASTKLNGEVRQTARRIPLKPD